MASAPSLDTRQDKPANGRGDRATPPYDVRALQPVYREDEDSARFAGRRYDTRAPEWRAYRFAVCGVCLAADEVPYLRSIWQLGWLAVCPFHGTILLTRCERCHCGIRVSQLSVCAPFSPTTCNRCGESLLSAATDGPSSGHSDCRRQCSGVSERAPPRSPG